MFIDTLPTGGRDETITFTRMQKKTDWKDFEQGKNGVETEMVGTMKKYWDLHKRTDQSKNLYYL